MVRLAGQGTLRGALTWREPPLLGRHGALEEGESQQAEKTPGRHGCFVKTRSVHTLSRRFTPSPLSSLHQLSALTLEGFSNLAISLSTSYDENMSTKATNPPPPVRQASTNEKRASLD